MRAIRLLVASSLVLPGCGPGAADTAVPSCGSEGGEPMDLVPWARLRASAVRPAEGHDWARENQAAAGTLRDDVADNGWQPPSGAPAVLEIDLQPWLGRAVALDELTMVWTGQEPEVSVRLLPGCGLVAWAELEWVDPSAPLALAGACAGCVELVVSGGEDTVITAVSLTSRDGALSVPMLDPAVGLGALGSHPGSGLVEGFYGQPWSWRERQAALVTLARAGMDLYLYAPKDDPLHRDEWREAYDAEAMEAFAEVAGLARELGVHFAPGVSPFIDLDSEDEADLETLYGKLAAFVELGITGVALLADDIEYEADVEVGAELGAAQVVVANRLLSDLREIEPGLRLLFVPTVYSDARLARWPGAPAYLEALAELDADIQVMWTGTGTFCDSLEAADLEDFRSLVGRDPLIWDNYWANDAYDLLAGRVQLAAYGGRAGDLAGAVAGIGANPMVQGSLSRLNAGALAAWLASPGPADVDEARAMAAGLEASLGYGYREDVEGDAAPLVRVMEAFDGHGLELPDHGELRSGVESVAAALEGDGSSVAVAAGELVPVLAGLVTVGDELHHSGLDSELVDELRYPLLRVRYEALAGLWAFTALGERLAGREGPLDRAREWLDLAGESRFLFTMGAVEDLVDAVEGTEVQDVGLARPAVRSSSPAGCVVGQAVRWQPFAGAAGVQVFGLPEAVVQLDGHQGGGAPRSDHAREQGRAFNPLLQVRDLLLGLGKGLQQGSHRDQPWDSLHRVRGGEAQGFVHVLQRFRGFGDAVQAGDLVHGPDPALAGLDGHVDDVVAAEDLGDLPVERKTWVVFGQERVHVVVGLQLRQDL